MQLAGGGVLDALVGARQRRSPPLDQLNTHHAQWGLSWAWEDPGGKGRENARRWMRPEEQQLLLSPFHAYQQSAHPLEA